MPLTREFREQYDAAWRRLTKNGAFELNLFDSIEDQEPQATWYVFHQIFNINPVLITSRDCMIMDYPQGIDLLNAHPTDKYELVLRVRRPRSEENRGHEFAVKSFENRAEANRALKEGNEH